MAKVGDRIGAVISASAETKSVEFAGYGVYIGDEIPPEGIQFMGLDLHEMKRENPRLDLDNGQVIWGCQCWWGDLDTVAKQLEQYTQAGYVINIADPAVYAQEAVKS